MVDYASFISKLLITYIIGLFLLSNINYLKEFIQTQGRFPDVAGNWSPMGACLITPLLLIAVAFCNLDVLTWNHVELDMLIREDLGLKLFVLWFFLVPIFIIVTLIWKAFQYVFRARRDTGDMKN